MASQCAAMGHLHRLDEAARGLNAVLLDPDVGAFEPGLPDGQSLLTGQLQPQDVVDRVREAIRYASQEGAVLALGFLGHGFLPANDPTLHFMTHRSLSNARHSAVNVNQLLVEAADAAGVHGVLAVVDTCHASAGIPDLSRLKTGLQRGRVPLAILAGAAVHQDAYDLDLSRCLTKLLWTGSDNERLSSRLFIDGAMTGMLRLRLLRQDVDHVTSGADDDLWLAANRAVAPALARGEGVAALRQAVAEWRPDLLKSSWDGVELRTLGQQAAAESIMNPQALIVGSIVARLLAARQTHSFVETWGTARLTSTALRRALRVVVGQAHPPTAEQASDLGLMLDHVALTSPLTDLGLRSRMVDFILELLREVQHTPDRASLDDWARAIGAMVVLNGKRKQAEFTRRRNDLRLVAVFNSSPTGSWPESIDFWLLNGELRLGHTTIACIPDQQGGEAAVLAAISWAADHDEAGWEIARVDIAAPAGLLLDWRPEEINAAGKLLGVDYDIRLHWKERLRREHALRAAQRWRRHSELDSVTEEHRPCLLIHWLDEAALDEDALRRRIERGQFGAALGLLPFPAAAVLETILPEVPIVIWRHRLPMTREHQSALEAHWLRLPQQLSTAYRDCLATESADPLSEVRAIWDDTEWLTFARHFGGSS